MSPELQSVATQFHDRLIRKLEAINPLSDDERDAIRALPFLARDFAPDQDIVSIGDRPSASCVIVEGWVCRYKITPSGGRQILAFHIPGDMPDQQSLYLRTLDHSVASLTPLTVAFIAHRDLLELVRRFEGIARALWRDALVDAAIFREWMVGIGRRSGHQRIAHVMCEMAIKAESVGLNDGCNYPWPVTQVELADALGLTDVHVNRILRDLRLSGLVDVKRGSFTVHDWHGLKKEGQFDPHYLHLQQQAA
jgi:CRP-like cAMP-binding protein